MIRREKSQSFDSCCTLYHFCGFYQRSAPLLYHINCQNMSASVTQSRPSSSERFLDSYLIYDFQRTLMEKSRSADRFPPGRRGRILQTSEIPISFHRLLLRYWQESQLHLYYRIYLATVGNYSHFPVLPSPPPPAFSSLSPRQKKLSLLSI